MEELIVSSNNTKLDNIVFNIFIKIREQRKLEK